MKWLPLVFFLLAAAAFAAQLLVVIPYELRYVDELSRWLGHTVFSVIELLRRSGGISMRWDIASFAFCVTTTLAFVSGAIELRRRREARMDESA